MRTSASSHIPCRLYDVSIQDNMRKNTIQNTKYKIQNTKYKIPNILHRLFIHKASPSSPSFSSCILHFTFYRFFHLLIQHFSSAAFINPLLDFPHGLDSHHVQRSSSVDYLDCAIVVRQFPNCPSNRLAGHPQPCQLVGPSVDPDLQVSADT